MMLLQYLYRCDLLSKVLFTIFVTASYKDAVQKGVLWFAFKSSFYNICHSLKGKALSELAVVICFQKFFLQYLSQRWAIMLYRHTGCDLLSKVLFTIFVTAGKIRRRISEALWFAFKSSFYNICHSISRAYHKQATVVICFQKFFLQYLSQLSDWGASFSISCDLLSKVLFTIFVTADQLDDRLQGMLWFAFKSSFYNICHSLQPPQSYRI